MRRKWWVLAVSAVSLVAWMGVAALAGEKKEKPKKELSPEERLFKEFDVNKDGKIDLKEAKKTGLLERLAAQEKRQPRPPLSEEPALRPPKGRQMPERLRERWRSMEPKERRGFVRGRVRERFRGLPPDERQRLGERWRGMEPEERKAFVREKARERFGGLPTEGRERRQAISPGGGMRFRRGLREEYRPGTRGRLRERFGGPSLEKREGLARRPGIIRAPEGLRPGRQRGSPGGDEEQRARRELLQSLSPEQRELFLQTLEPEQREKVVRFFHETERGRARERFLESLSPEQRDLVPRSKPARERPDVSGLRRDFEMPPREPRRSPRERRNYPERRLGPSGPFRRGNLEQESGYGLMRGESTPPSPEENIGPLPPEEREAIPFGPMSEIISDWDIFSNWDLLEHSGALE